MTMAKGKQASQAAERTRAKAERKAPFCLAVPWRPRTIWFDRAPHTDPEDDAEEAGETRL